MKTLKVVKSKESRYPESGKSSIKAQFKKSSKSFTGKKPSKADLARAKAILTLSVNGSKPRIIQLPDVWTLFSRRLADALARLKNKQYLVLTVGDTNRFVQFASLKGGGIRAETTSNCYLPKEYQFNERQIVALAQMGWEVPTKTRETLSENKEPGGSPNFFVDFDRTVSYEVLATLATRTFVEIFSVLDPSSLVYDAFKRKGKLIDMPDLLIAKRIPQEKTLQDIPVLLLETLKEVTGLTDIEPDKDGDIGISCGSAVTYVRLIDDGKRIHLFSPVLCEVNEGPEVLERLKVLNANSMGMEFTFVSGAIYAGVDVSAQPYDGARVAIIFEQFSQVADSMGILLQEDFGGKTWIAKSLPSVMRH